MDRNITEILKTLDAEGGKIKFSYSVDKKSMEFFVEDAKSRDCLVKSIEIHLPLIPESILGYFSVFKYDLKNMKFDGKKA